MAGDQRYGPKGFTDAPEVRAIIDKHLVSWEFNTPDFCRFDGLSVPEAERLLELLPAAQADDAQNYAPTFGQFVVLGQQCPGLLLEGYRIGPEREDERISIEAIEIPEDEVTPQVLDFLRSFGPDMDRWTVYGRCPRCRHVWRAWWD